MVLDCVRSRADRKRPGSRCEGPCTRLPASGPVARTGKSAGDPLGLQTVRVGLRPLQRVAAVRVAREQLDPCTPQLAKKGRGIGGGAPARARGREVGRARSSLACSEEALAGSTCCWP